MISQRHHFELLRENVLQHLSYADDAIVKILDTDDAEVSEDEPWLTELFERRQSLQSTLADLEQQIKQLSA
jgi:hypothetical protein